MFEVQDLRYATLATVSRCGMVWFSEDVLSLDMIFDNFTLRLKNIPIDEGEEALAMRQPKQEVLSPTLQVSLARKTFFKIYVSSACVDWWYTRIQLTPHFLPL